ncbi:hypothetical protein SteCoe_25250 [Stentor coeruleus]|uniref:Uncharacterized protein n=1 Tax=Stentor coeruleus TaxID=5963 RepID=A0A1R2BFV0_9CILI|nr:hypothetical protein SteCoe_25250 [Stentor coeruleus]
MRNSKLISLSEAVKEMELMEEKLANLKQDNPMVLTSKKIDKLNMFFYEDQSMWDDDDMYFMNKSVRILRGNIGLWSLYFGCFAYFFQNSIKVQSLNIEKSKKFALISAVGLIMGFSFYAPALAYCFRVNAYLKLKYIPSFDNYVKPEQVVEEEVSKS